MLGNQPTEVLKRWQNAGDATSVRNLPRVMGQPLMALAASSIDVGRTG